MNVQEMAQTLIDMTTEDEEATRSWSTIEDATFSAYASQYIEASSRPGCKGCHGG